MAKQAIKFEAQQRVAVPFEGDVYRATVVRMVRGGKVRVRFDDDTEATVKAADCEVLKRGRRALTESLTPDELQAEIDGLLAALKKAGDTDEKKAIRRALRRRGHKGGLGIRPATVVSIKEANGDS